MVSKVGAGASASPQETESDQQAAYVGAEGCAAAKQLPREPATPHKHPEAAIQGLLEAALGIKVGCVYVYLQCDHPSAQIVCPGLAHMTRQQRHHSW